MSLSRVLGLTSVPPRTCNISFEVNTLKPLKFLFWVLAKILFITNNFKFVKLEKHTFYIYIPKNGKR